MLFDELNRLADGLDLLRGVVRDVDLKLLLEFHHQFDRVEGIGTEIVNERSFRGDLILADAQLGRHDVDHTFLDGRRLMNPPDSSSAFPADDESETMTDSDPIQAGMIPGPMRPLRLLKRTLQTEPTSDGNWRLATG